MPAGVSKFLTSSAQVLQNVGDLAFASQVNIRGFRAHCIEKRFLVALISRRDHEPVRLHNALGSRDLGLATGFPLGRHGCLSDAAQNRQLIGRYGFLTFSA